jgi:hypothetical protein
VGDDAYRIVGSRESAEDIAVLRIALTTPLRVLPRRQREVIVLRYLVGLPDSEVAETLGMSTLPGPSPGRPVSGEVEELMERSVGAIRAKVPQRLVVVGFACDERTTRRADAEAD